VEPVFSCRSHGDSWDASRHIARLVVRPLSHPHDKEVMMVEVTWIQPYLPDMLHKTLPTDVVKAWRIVQSSKAFVVVKGELYKKSISRVLQRCVTLQVGQAILHDIHAGVCGHHASS
jgi:hypothetical protein